MFAGTYGEKFRKGDSKGLCFNTFALVRAFFAVDFFAFVFGLTLELIVLALRAGTAFDGVDFFAFCPTFGLAPFVGRLDDLAFVVERDAAFPVAALTFGLVGFFLLGFAAEDFLSAILTSYPCARNGVAPEQAA